MSSKIVRIAAALLATALFARTSSATIINLDGTTGDPVSIFLATGMYDITPIGVEAGGLYNAYDGSNDHPGNWVHAYTISSEELGSTLLWDGTVHESDLEALANAVSTQFAITFDQEVAFFIFDTSYADNDGGVSLRLQPVPEPSTLILLALGILGLYMVRARSHRSVVGRFGAENVARSRLGSTALRSTSTSLVR